MNLSSLGQGHTVTINIKMSTTTFYFSSKKKNSIHDSFYAVKYFCTFEMIVEPCSLLFMVFIYFSPKQISELLVNIFIFSALGSSDLSTSRELISYFMVSSFVLPRSFLILEVSGKKSISVICFWLFIDVYNKHTFMYVFFILFY